MKIPKEFPIKGNIWQVKHRWNLRLGDVPVSGLCDLEARTIWLDKALTKPEKPRVFLHELFHALVYECHLSGVDGGINEIAEEVLADGIAFFLDLSFSLRWKGQSGR